MFKTKQIRKQNPYMTATHDIWFFKNLAYFLPEDDTRIQKRVGEDYFMCALIRNCAFGWYS
jgi:hypothetical protein